MDGTKQTGPKTLLSLYILWLLMLYGLKIVSVWDSFFDDDEEEQ